MDFTARMDDTENSETSSMVGNYDERSDTIDLTWDYQIDLESHHSYATEESEYSHLSDSSTTEVIDPILCHQFYTLGNMDETLEKTKKIILDVNEDVNNTHRKIDLLTMKYNRIESRANELRKSLQEDIAIKSGEKPSTSKNELGKSLQEDTAKNSEEKATTSTNELRKSPQEDTAENSEEMERIRREEKERRLDECYAALKRALPPSSSDDSDC